MASYRAALVALSTILASASVASAATCDTSTLNTTSYLYPITVANTTIEQVANATGRGLCNIGRMNFMADVDIIPNVGQSIVIPGEVCDDEIDNTSCVVDNYNSTNTCLTGGPRLYYTVNGDTYRKIANRLDIAVSTLASDGDEDTVLTAGQFVKIPLCTPSTCSFEPFQFSDDEPLVYKDLADKYGSTVGQLMQLSPTYNYSQSGYVLTQTPPTIVLPFNCSINSDNFTVIT